MNALTEEQRAALELELAKEKERTHEDSKQSQIVVQEVLGRAELFHDGDTTYATMRDTNRTLPLLDQKFKTWLGKIAYEALGTPASGSTRGDVLAVVQGIALYDRPQEKAHVRLARHGESIYLDLGGTPARRSRSPRAVGVSSSALPCASGVRMALSHSRNRAMEGA